MARVRRPRTKRAGFNLSRLRRPKAKHDLRRQLLASTDNAGKKVEGFETQKKMKKEKARRAKSLERLSGKVWGTKSKLRARREAARLSKLLRRAIRTRDLPSFANPLFMRALRRRLLGELLRLIGDTPADEARVYTIAAPKWKRPASQLDSLRPRKLRETSRTSLIKAGLNQLTGWSIAFFHNEYDRSTDSYQPHFHVIVVGEKYRAFEALRELKMFQGGRGKSVYRPIVCQLLRDPARQISYLFKGYWLQQSSRIDQDTGGTRRHLARRMREMRHAESILFLHRQSFSDLVWLHGIRISRRRLVPEARE